MVRKIRRITELATVALIMVMVTGAIGLTIAPVVADAQSVRVLVTAPATVMPGDTFTATVNITQVQNFDATNYDVLFNPAVLQLTETGNVTSGNIGGTIIPVDAAHQASPGAVRIVQNVPGVRGISGSGYLAQLQFRVVGASGQSSNIDLTNGMLGSANATEIPSNWAGVAVRVVSSSSGGQESSPVPPPVMQNPPPPPPEEVTPGDLSPVPATQTPTSPVVPPLQPGTLGNTPIVPVPAPVPTPTPTPTPVPVPAPAPPPSAQSEELSPLLLWGVIGGVIGIIVVGGLIILQMKRRGIKIAEVKK